MSTDTSTSAFDRLEHNAKALGIDFSSQEFATLASTKDYTSDQIQAIVDVFSTVEQKKHETVINTILKMSRLPLKVPKTFDNFNFDRLHGKDTATVKALVNLSEVHAGKNLALIGPPGVGKTHLAEAYGRACCMEGMKTYFLKATELNEKFIASRKASREASLMNSLVKPTCLIIDEIGRCTFDAASTRMFFDLLDRRYMKEGPKCIIFTSNKQPSLWSEFFESTDDLAAALDRAFDEAVIINFKGTSYRGQQREILSVGAGEAEPIQN